MLPFVFQFTHDKKSSTGLVSKRAKSILDLVSRHKKEPLRERQDDFITTANFDGVKIQKKDDHIYYIGSITTSITVIGFINFEGSGEEVYIQKNTAKNSKKHKILMYKTAVDYKRQKYDYFTKQTIKSLIRTRMS